MVAVTDSSRTRRARLGANRQTRALPRPGTGTLSSGYAHRSLDPSPSDAGQLASRRQPVDLAALLAGIRASIPASGVSIDIAVAPGTTARGNLEELSRMFRNIVDNAARHARHRVLITAVRKAGDITVDISEDGPGIPTAERERVFARFVRLDPSRGQVSGSAGLGLAIARDIATAQGASTSFRS